MYYVDKIKFLIDIFGIKNISVEHDFLLVGNKKYPIIDDVIILLEPKYYTDFVKMKLQLNSKTINEEGSEKFAKDVQFTFGEEWRQYNKILKENKKDFLHYFDIVDMDSLKNSWVCDLGCGIGRWSYFLKDICKGIFLVDFSDAIFIARENLSDYNNCLFFMGDLAKLPFRDDFVDFLFCLGVLHHLPTPCLNVVRTLKRFAPALLIYTYYSLDNRPIYYRLILKIVNLVRLNICKVRNPFFRKIFTHAVAFLIYIPLIFLGSLLNPIGLSKYIPLYEGYHGKNLWQIKQDIYDRFFTPIEQRVSRKEILKLQDTFTKVIISDKLPYWHFICHR